MSGEQKSAFSLLRLEPPRATKTTTPRGRSGGFRALAMAKTFSSNAPGPMSVQLYAAFVYFSLSYFIGTVGDDLTVGVMASKPKAT